MRNLILIVSNPPIPETSKYFATEVYDVQLATSAEIMVDFLAARTPDVVIVDADSVGIDFEEVRRLVSPPHQTEIIPLIWLLDRGDIVKYGFPDPDKLWEFGIPDEDYSTKPYDPMELALRAKNAIARRQHGR
jgi:DNA-binding response OmpR family regulator